MQSASSSRRENRALLILDLDETLIYSTETRLDRPPDLEIGPFAVYARPFLSEFLDLAFRRFEVAVWTSAQPAYASSVVEALFPAGSRLAFLWARDRCTLVPDRRLRQVVVLKDLKKVRRRGYDIRRIVAVDDVPAYYSRSRGNLVLIRPYLGRSDDQELPQLARFLEQLADSADVRRADKGNWRDGGAGPG